MTECSSGHIDELFKMHFTSGQDEVTGTEYTLTAPNGQNIQSKHFQDIGHLAIKGSDPGDLEIHKVNCIASF